jgi:hypothetical protein
MPLESCENDRSQGTPLPPSKPIYHDVDLTKVGDALRHQVSGAHRLAETFEKAKAVSQESLDYEVSL